MNSIDCNMDQRSKSRKICQFEQGLYPPSWDEKAKLGISDTVVENAAYIYRKAVGAKLTRAEP